MPAHAAQALLLKVQTLRLHAPDRLSELLGPTFELLRTHPDTRTALVAAAQVMGTLAALPEFEHVLSEKKLLVGRSCLPQASSKLSGCGAALSCRRHRFAHTGLASSTRAPVFCMSFMPVVSCSED